jgi:DNA polymerase-3 subunit epsilon
VNLADIDRADRVVVIDFEGTGNRPKVRIDMIRSPRSVRLPGVIIEIGAVELLRTGDGWRKGENFYSKVNPEGPVNHVARGIHGISAGELRKAPRFADLHQRFFAFLGERDPIVAHAIDNERELLSHELARMRLGQWGEKPLPGRWLCTQELFVELFPKAPKSLDAVCDKLSLDRSHRLAAHGALLDADLTADALLVMRDILASGFDPDEAVRWRYARR